MLRLNRKHIFFLGLILIITVYSLYNIYFDLTSVPDIPGKLKHVNKFFFMVLIYGIGTLALRKYTVGWMMQVWHLIHIVFIAALLVIGIYDWLHGSITNEVRNLANTLYEFLISPVLYVCIGIIQFRLFNDKEA